MDPTGKNDFDAGLLFFAAVSRMYPGITWDDILQPQRMAGWLTDLGHAVGNVKDGIGDVLKDTVSTVGDIGGSTVRLAADPAVASAITRAGSAYATGGASEGANSIMAALGNIFSPQGQQVVSQAGAAYKQNVGGFSFSNPWVLGGTAAAAALLLILVVKK
jgi:hypothetical protein